jgi:hypothetical protein
MVFKATGQQRRIPVPVMFRDTELKALTELSGTLGKNRSETIRFAIFLVYKKVFNREPDILLDNNTSVI